MSNFGEVRVRAKEVETNPSLEGCKKLILSIIKLLDSKIDDDDLDLFDLFTDDGRKLAANASWFFSDSKVKDHKATYQVYEKNDLNLDFKMFGVQNSSKRIISWSQALTPNFEDELFYQDLRVGIDFIVPKSYDRVFVALSNNYVVRILELHGNLTATYEEIFSKWESIGDFSNKRYLHTILWESFDLHPINKQFYEGIAERFVSLRQFLTHHKILDEDHASQFANRLIGRLVFCWFLKKKNFIEASHSYFSSTSYTDDTRYYREKLEILFFDVLNKPMSERSSNDTATPYLNGGLFEEKADDLVQNQSLKFPKNYFDDFYAFLDSYNFTTDESTSQYQQVAIDPEMLGRIFENLLAEMTDESGEQARKAKGAFYTPREIVDFMCRETLKKYLESALPEDPQLEQRLGQLIDGSDREFQDQDHNWRRDWKPYKEKLLAALNDLRVLDPACGSGAFPMGMLQLLLKVYDRLDPALGKDTYAMKLQIISNNLFGVDIEPMAVEISRLRAWLSLVVDLESEKRKIKPLPNLDFRFVCANSLIPLDLSNAMMFGEDPELGQKLDDIRKQYFTTESMTKKKKHRAAYEKLIVTDASLFGESRRTTQLKSYHPFDTSATSSFFDPGNMFGCKDFQIVIGNPPYVKKEHLDDSVIAELELSYREGPTGKQKPWSDDLYVHFIFRAFELVSSKGVVSYITNDSFLGLSSKERVRKVLIDSGLDQIVLCPPETFSATIYTAVFLAIPSKGTCESYQARNFVFPDFSLTPVSEVHKSFVDSLPNTRLVTEEDELVRSLLVEEKIGKYMSFLDTGIDSGNVREKLFSKSKTDAFSERIIQGRQISVWFVNWAAPSAKFRYCNPKYAPQDTLGIGRGGKESKKKEYWGFRGDIENHHKPERVLVRQTSDSVIAAYHSESSDGQLYTDNTLFTCFSKNEIPLKYFLAFLNSGLYNYVYQYLSAEQGKTLAQVKIGLLEVLPFRHSLADQDELVDLVDSAIQAAKKGSLDEVKKIEDLIDERVCHIMGISAAAKEVVMKSWLDTLERE
jgi:type I restriction-modification system DNA methylase subunit